MLASLECVTHQHATAPAAPFSCWSLIVPNEPYRHSNGGGDCDEAPPPAGAAFLMWEVSTFFVHARWFLFKLGAADSRWYLANGLAMLASFFVFRCAAACLSCSTAPVAGWPHRTSAGRLRWCPCC
jgi:hypothetical protein